MKILVPAELQKISTPANAASGYLHLYPKTDDRYYRKTSGGNERPIDSPDRSVSVENPTASEDLTLFFNKYARTVKEIDAVLIGSASPSVTWTIRYGTDRSAVGTEVVTGGTATTSITTAHVITTFNSASIPADNWVWLETTAKAGTVTLLSLTVIFD